MSLLERVYSFHQDILDNRFPNATTLVKQFEISLATARRDIAYLRDRLLAPLCFDTLKNGYYYSDDSFSLPFTQSPKIILLIAMLQKLAEEAGLRELPELKQLETKLSSLLKADYHQLHRSLYCEWIELESIDPDIFSSIIQAVINQRGLELTYSSAKGKNSNRVVEPQRLCNYQGRWYLLGFCRLRNGLRMFHLARIGAVSTLDEKITPIENLEERYLQPAFGIFKGETTYKATIHFSHTAAELVAKQHWHKEQQIEQVEGGILLTLPVSDDREIAMKVLQYGSQARVINPPQLQQFITDEIKAMNRLYGDPAAE